MKNELPQAYTMRAATMDDAQSVTDLIIACDIEEFGRPEYGLEDLLAMWRREDFDLANDSHVILANDGTFAAYMDMYDRGDIIQLNNNSCVHPAHKNRGIEEWMLERAEEWAREHATDEPIVIRHVLNADAPERVARMKDWGYKPVRNAWIMQIILDECPHEPQVSPGIVIRPMQLGNDEKLVWHCIQEAFRDLWQHQDSPYAEWSALVLENANLAPDLSFLAFDCELVVGATVTMVAENGAWIQQVGVRRPWRGRGIGLALLETIFAELYKRGIHEAGLEVDAENPSGALRLYERAGMHVYEHFTEFRKVIVGRGEAFSVVSVNQATTASENASPLR